MKNNDFEEWDNYCGQCGTEILWGALCYDCMEENRAK